MNLRLGHRRGGDVQTINTIYAILGTGSIFAGIGALIWWAVDIINEKRRQEARERLSRRFDKVKENSLDDSKEGDDPVSCHQKDIHR